MKAVRTKKQKKPKNIASTQSLSSFVKSICDIMRRSNCASALQYVPELTWILFLRILDAQEEKAREEAEAIGNSFSPALRAPYRWQDWAAPYPRNEVDKEHHPKTESSSILSITISYLISTAWILTKRQASPIRM
jgi:type I restriction enzyme M protein